MNVPCTDSDSPVAADDLHDDANDRASMMKFIDDVAVERVMGLVQKIMAESGARKALDLEEPPKSPP